LTAHQLECSPAPTPFYFEACTRVFVCEVGHGLG
jgi:hypothetical protein